MVFSKSVVIAICTLLGSTGVALAVEIPDVKPQPVQELIRTEVVYPQEKGEVQLTLASLFDNGRGSDRLSVPVALEYGLTDAWQVEAQLGSFSRIRSGSTSAAGLSGLSLGTKYKLMNIAGRP